MKYIGGDFSWDSLTPFLSVEEGDHRSFFPDKIRNKTIDFYQTGADALAAIIQEALTAFTPSEKKVLWFPEHYCFSSIERVKTTLQTAIVQDDIEVRTYKAVSDITHYRQPANIVIVLHLNKFEPNLQTTLCEPTSIAAVTIEDFVLCPLDIRHFKGDYAFNSLRKFVPLDIAVAYKNEKLTKKQTDESYGYYRKSAAHLKSLVETELESEYEEDYLYLFKKAEKVLEYRTGIFQPSPDTFKLFKSVDFKGIQNIRKQNYSYLEEKLSQSTALTQLDGEYMYFMMLHDNRDALRKYFFSNHVFPAIHWPDSLSETSKAELSFPVDQRYTNRDMDRIIDLLNGY